MIANRWLYLSQMPNEQMVAMFRADCLTRDEIEFLHSLRINRVMQVSHKQATRLADIAARVRQFEIIHPAELNDDDVTAMIKALADEPAKPAPTWRPLGATWGTFKDSGDGE